MLSGALLAMLYGRPEEEGRAVYRQGRPDP